MHDGEVPGSEATLPTKCDTPSEGRSTLRGLTSQLARQPSPAPVVADEPNRGIATAP
jgi:hypothetical protein